MLIVRSQQGLREDRNVVYDIIRPAEVKVRLTLRDTRGHIE